MFLTSLVAFLPVLSFLLLLIVFDSFKLVPTSMFVRALAAGVLAALAASVLQAGLLAAFPLDARTVARYVAPLTEEALKMLFVLWALFRRQIGFLVDAAIGALVGLRV